MVRGQGGAQHPWLSRGVGGVRTALSGFMGPGILSQLRPCSLFAAAFVYQDEICTNHTVVTEAAHDDQPVRQFMVRLTHAQPLTHPTLKRGVHSL